VGHLTVTLPILFFVFYSGFALFMWLWRKNKTLAALVFVALVLSPVWACGIVGLLIRNLR
jgi:hypothetical protein